MPSRFAADRCHPPARLDRPAAQVVGDRFRQLLVPTGKVEVLVRLAEDREAGAGGLAVEQVDDVERRLVVRVGAVLLRVRRVEQAAEPRAVAAGDVLLDPAVDGQPVEKAAGRRRAGVRRRVAGRVVLVVEDLQHRLEVTVELLVRVVVAEEPVRLGRVRRLRGEHVGDDEPEAVGEREDRLVAAVDQLAAPLARLSVRPVGVGRRYERAVRVHAAADPVGRRLVDGGGHACVGEGQRGGQTGDTAADDGDPRRRRRVRARCARESEWAGRDHGACDSGALEELAARERALRAPFAQLGRGDPEPVGAPVLLRQSLDRLQQRRAGHSASPSVAGSNAPTISHLGVKSQVH